MFQKSSMTEESGDISIFCSPPPFLHPHLPPLPLDTRQDPDNELLQRGKAEGRSRNQVNEEENLTSLPSVT